MLAGLRTIAIIGVTLAGCSDSSRSAVASLDQGGRWMLDPIRGQALAPEQLVARLNLPKNAVVADIGAGPGFLTLPLARAVPEGKVIATDLRADYLAAVEERAREARIENITTRVVRVDELGLEAASIELALLCQVDHALADRVSYLRSLLPVLKNGGRIALVNSVRYREANEIAAATVGLEVIDAWQPSPPYFAMVLAAREARN